jgi:hypothetical protein
MHNRSFDVENLSLLTLDINQFFRKLLDIELSFTRITIYMIHCCILKTETKSNHD